MTVVDTDLPIPAWDEAPDWGRLPIVECGEPLVALPTDGRGGVRVRALYAEQGIPHAPQTVSVREGVRQRLYQAARSLPHGVALVVFDGYRPLAVQQYLYDSFYADAARERPELTDEALRAYIGQFVARPVADPDRPPPHRTGGAVDVYLIDTATGEPLPMGTDADEISAASATHYFETTGEEPYRANRRLLYHALAGAGFANYRGEWWHYEWGNQRWANLAGASHAIYGIATEE